MNTRTYVKRFLAGAVVTAGLTLAAVAQYPSYTPPVVVEAPFFGARYVEEPAAPPGAPAGGADDLRAVLARIEGKLDRLLKLAGGPPAALTSGANVCFACHRPEAAAEKGAGFAMFERNEKGDGYALAKIDGPMAARLVRKVKSGSMPMAPARPLTDAEKAAVIAAYSAPK
jgi:mono/diheme cytochrome c family protein